MCGPGASMMGQNIMTGLVLAPLPVLKPRKNKTKLGRSKVFHPSIAEPHIENLFDYHGLLSPDDPEWCCQADIERALIEIFSKEIGREPSVSTVRPMARDFMAKYNDKKHLG